MSNLLSCAGLFSGIGGFCFGFEKLGFQTKWVNELEEHVASVYKHNFPQNKVINKDVRELSVAGDSLEAVDVLHAGFPCQSFSVAGNRRGFDDERGALFYEIIRLIKEFGASKPKILLLENSPNLLVGEGGDWIDSIFYELRRNGYWVGLENCHILNTHEHGGLPQNRERVFICAVSQEHFVENPLLEVGSEKTMRPISTLIDLAKKQDAKYYLPYENRYGEMLTKALENKPKHSLAQLRKYEVRHVKHGKCPTLTANMGAGGHNVPFLRDEHGLRKLTESECLALQGFPDSFRWTNSSSSGKRYHMIGNSVSPIITEMLAAKIKQVLLEEELAA